MKYYFLVAVLTVLFVLFLLPGVVYSEDHSSRVYLSEFMANPDDGGEWVEIYNKGSDPMVLNGWYIADSRGPGSAKKFSIEIAGGEYGVVSISSSFLNNGGDSVVLLDEEKKEVDSVSYEDSEKGLTWARESFPNGKWCLQEPSPELENGLCTLPTETPTPTPEEEEAHASITPSPSGISNTPTVTLTPTPQSYSNVVISEAMVAPETGEKEWVELVNSNDFSVELEDWYLDDEVDAGASPKRFSVTISANGRVVIEMSSAVFNNSGDMVRLLDANYEEKDGFTYSFSQKGKSFGTFGDSTDFCLQEPTLGEANSDCIQEEDESAKEEESTSSTKKTSQSSSSTKKATTSTSVSASSKPSGPTSTSSNRSSGSFRSNGGTSPEAMEDYVASIQKGPPIGESADQSLVLVSDEGGEVLGTSIEGNKPTVQQALIRSLSFISASFSLSGMVSLIFKVLQGRL